MFPEYKKIEAKTASYQVVAADIGKILTTYGASGAVTFTLPVTTSILTGWHCRFFQAADQNMIIASYGSSDDIVTKNDLAADTITFSTATELIGNGVEVVWDGTKWLAFLMTEETVTVTIA
jgi:hypothetical protein